MKFLLSEGRVICLLEREDATTLPSQLGGRSFPEIDLLVIPVTIRDHIENSHVWTQIYPKVRQGLRNVVYF